MSEVGFDRFELSYSGQSTLNWRYCARNMSDYQELVEQQQEVELVKAPMLAEQLTGHRTGD